jgi:hypothetical protein
MQLRGFGISVALKRAHTRVGLVPDRIEECSDVRSTVYFFPSGATIVACMVTSYRKGRALQLQGGLPHTNPPYQPLGTPKVISSGALCSGQSESTQHQQLLCSSLYLLQLFTHVRKHFAFRYPLLCASFTHYGSEILVKDVETSTSKPCTG